MIIAFTYIVHNEWKRVQIEEVKDLWVYKERPPQVIHHFDVGGRHKMPGRCDCEGRLWAKECIELKCPECRAAIYEQS